MKISVACPSKQKRFVFEPVGQTLREILVEVRRQDNLLQELLAEDGSPRGFVKVSLNDTLRHAFEMDRVEVADGDHVDLLMAVAGG